MGLTWLAPGFSLGLALSLGLSRWTWLEMRWNSGQAWWLLGLLVLVLGLVRGRRPKLVWLLASDGLLLLMALSRGPGALGVLPGALLREGLGLSQLSLVAANTTIILLLGSTHLCFFSYRKSCLHKSLNQMRRAGCGPSLAGRDQ